MNDFLKRALDRIKKLFSQWSVAQRLIFGGVIVAVIVAIILLASLSAAPTMVKLLGTPIKTEDELRLITSRLDTENIAYQVDATNQIMVKDKKTALRARGILIREDLIPRSTDPWSIFDVQRWTVTEFEQNVNLRRAIIGQVTKQIEALDDVDKAAVTVVMPEDKVFKEDQKAVTASIIVFSKPGSDLVTNQKKIQGIQKIIKFAVEGLIDDNIVITDSNGIILNDFSNLAEYNRIIQTKNEQKTVQELEAKYRVLVLKSLQQIYTPDRVRDLNIKIDMDMSQKNIKTEEFYPVTIKPRTPKSPYDDSDVRPSVTRSITETTTEWQGTGFNPEGPAGAEGQTAPSYQDLQNMQGKMTQKSTVRNEELNKRNIDEVASPKIGRVTASVNIDGVWRWKYDAKGKPVMLPQGGIDREYVPVTAEELKKDQQLVQDAIGFNGERGDSVTVQNIPFDRIAQFKEEDTTYKNKVLTSAILFYALIALGSLLLAFVLIRIISREIERRRRLADERRALEQSLLRENALKAAEARGSDMNMSIDERRRTGLQEGAITAAREHPEEVAQLIRTWIREE